MKAYKTKAELKAYLDCLVDSGKMGINSDGSYYVYDCHDLRVGEYATPVYYPTRYKDGWGVAKVSYFYPGAVNPPPKRVRVYVHFKGV